MKRTTPKNKWKSWHETKNLFVEIADKLGTKIVEVVYTTPFGTSRVKPTDGCECTFAQFQMSGQKLVDSALELGFVKGYNGGRRPEFGELNVCYYKTFSHIHSKWGNTIQIWPDGKVRLVG